MPKAAMYFSMNFSLHFDSEIRGPYSGPSGRWTPFCFCSESEAVNCVPEKRRALLSALVNRHRAADSRPLCTKLNKAATPTSTTAAAAATATTTTTTTTTPAAAAAAAAATPTTPAATTTTTTTTTTTSTASIFASCNIDNMYTDKQMLLLLLPPLLPAPTATTKPEIKTGAPLLFQVGWIEVPRSMNFSDSLGPNCFETLSLQGWWPLSLWSCVWLLPYFVNTHRHQGSIWAKGPRAIALSPQRLLLDGGVWR